MRVLVVNAGSSSVKLALLDGDRTERSDSVAPDEAADGLERFLDGTDPPDGVGHRIVHGGREFTGPVRLDDDVLGRIADLRTLAPLHQDPAVQTVRRARSALPDVAHVACFDTTFHRTLPPAAHTYAVPARWRDELGVRRYGFHGLAHEWAGRRTAALLGRPEGELRTVNAHLGSGASLCAIHGGVSVDTTMGLTPTAGLVMGTRSGDLDPSVPLWLAARGLDPEQVAEDLDLRSGLLGLTGRSDAREVEDAAGRGEPDAVTALQAWAHRARAEVAAMAAAMGGIDALTFSGGVGEHQPRMRARVAEGLGFLGVEIDQDRNDAALGEDDGIISPAGCAVASLVVTAREDLVVAEQVRAVLGP
ncbi:acetate/propionate family kinase [Pseudonocardia sp. KRD291]|uniref:acetate/propionate family kinase n=1 Tax=Pseudonocardia sp. KRD291 TaxID=2792007 RepID=UPI001C4A0642|nr:acetate/propionate family kinase [Pseudonocardia sp. KRD291]MBW0102722.1 acetate/propionate family kinase [Pseudonocardia sp. KRD291]